MTPDSKKWIACRTRAGIAAAIFVSFVAAHAEFLVAAHAQVAPPALPGLIVAQAAQPVAAQSAPPTAVPAVVMPEHSALPETAKPASRLPADRAASVQTAGCTAPAEFSHLSLPLRHTARRIAGGKPLTVVAVGSSSTAGAGASSPAASYPSRLAVELQDRFPTLAITVINRGVNGEETPDMMARFETGVIAEHPQLVIWQVGTNSVLRDHPLGPHSELLHEGIDELKTTGTDVVLIDPQYAPKVLAKSETPAMVDQIAITAKEENVDLFRRFAVMRDWYEVQHLPFDVFVSPDGLHMNDWGYACVARLLARGIAEAATRPIASAAAHSR